MKKTIVLIVFFISTLCMAGINQYERVSKLISEKKYKEASVILDDLIKKDYKDIVAYYLYAELYKSSRTLEDLKMAESFYYKILTINPGDNTAKVNMGAIAFISGHVEKARILYEEVYKTAPNMKGVNLGLGLLALEKSKITDAKKYLKRETEIDKNNVDAMFNLSVIYSIKNFQDKAIEISQKILNLKTNLGDLEPVVYYNLACFYSLKHDTKNAVYNLKKSIEKGFKDFNHIKNDEDLAFIRTSKEYKELIK